jgi:hypothetical protein
MTKSDTVYVEANWVLLKSGDEVITSTRATYNEL